MSFDVFVSYAHEDSAVAERLQRDLSRVGTRWYRRDGLRVFRDETDLSANPALWPSIATAIDSSDALVVLCSPAAAASEWIEREIEHYLSEHGGKNLVLALVAGATPWDGDQASWRSLTATVPASLLVMPDLKPTVVDLRNRGRVDWQVAMVSLAAAVQAVPVAQVQAAQRREESQLRRHLAVVVVTLVALCLLTGWSSILASQASRRAGAAADETTSRRLAALAKQNAGTDPGLAVALAVEAWRTAPTADARVAVFSAVGWATDNEWHWNPARFPGDSRVPQAIATASAAEDDGKDDGKVVAGMSDGSLVAWWPDGKHPPQELGTLSVAVSDVSETKDGYVAVSRSGLVRWLSPDGTTVGRDASVGTEISSAAALPDGSVIAGTKDGTLVRVARDGRRTAATPPWQEVTAVATGGGHVVAAGLVGSAPRAALLDPSTLALTTPLAVDPKVSATISRLAVSRDGETLAALDDQGRLCTYAAADGRLRGTGDLEHASAGALDLIPYYSDDFLASTPFGVPVRYDDRATFVSTVTATHRGLALALAQAPDGYLVSTGWDGLRKQFAWLDRDLPLGRKVLTTLPENAWLAGGGADAGSLLAVSTDALTLVDVRAKRAQTLVTLPTPALTGPVLFAQVLPDGRRAVLLTTRGEVARLDLTGRGRPVVIARLPLTSADSAQNLLVDHDSAILVTAHTVRRISLEGRITELVSSPGRIYPVAVNDEGVVAAVIPGKRALVVARPGRPTLSFAASGVFGTAAAVSPDGREIALGDGYGRVERRSLDDGLALHQVPREGGERILAVHYGVDGHVMYTTPTGVSQLDEDGRELLSRFFSGETNPITTAMGAEDVYYVVGTTLWRLHPDLAEALRYECGLVRPIGDDIWRPLVGTAFRNPCRADE